MENTESQDYFFPWLFLLLSEGRVQDQQVLLYWYCDIVEYTRRPEDNALIVTDLLADIILYPDGRMHVVDLDELAEALEKGLITQAQMTACLRQLNNLITIIYRDKFDRLQSPLEKSGL